MAPRRAMRLCVGKTLCESPAVQEHAGPQDMKEWFATFEEALAQLKTGAKDMYIHMDLGISTSTQCWSSKVDCHA